MFDEAIAYCCENGLVEREDFEAFKTLAEEDRKTVAIEVLFVAVKSFVEAGKQQWKSITEALPQDGENVRVLIGNSESKARFIDGDFYSAGKPIYPSRWRIDAI